MSVADRVRAAVEIGSMGKSYGPTVALDSVTLDLRPGEVHALLGENGAGKSTLVKALSGIVRPDRGTMRIEGRDYRPRSILDARSSGVATAFQELSLLPNLSVAENLLLPRLPKRGLGLSSASATCRSAEEILARFDLDHIDPSAPMASLALADRQRIEIARAMLHATRLLVLDEPTAALADVEWLFSLVRAIQAKGTAILYISHRLGEVRALCDRATVLRNGRSIATVDLAGASDARIFEMMVGRSSGHARKAPASVAASDRAALEVRSLRAGALKDVSFALRPGEIVGVAGLEGQGQRELFRSLVGLVAKESGEILVDGRSCAIGSPREALKAGGGLAYLPEERKSEGILATLTTAANMAMPVLSSVSRGGVVSAKRERAVVATQAERVDLASRYLPFRIADLSGGNQQKALIGRVITTGARTLLLFDPTRGVDVGTKQSIYEAIRRFAEGGGSVLFYSSELPEIVSLAHRCLVLYGGRVAAEFAGEAIEEQALVGALLGAVKPELGEAA
ncbi:sugar ABC transporter ATP-binding protein [Aureimonas flava]|uniref:Sugar ABC transporter ATP-binding protein n=1 Tax=Aureimonas flava TaxID=2320271 RepID=A0A3A1WI65_9HYPH|nr:sugar ABC transporter ATP-binding protein [Aureimonas flava]RIX98165.1 sugar ABC transporter ATP-binding protein [Aureimonas flava]